MRDRGGEVTAWRYSYRLSDDTVPSLDGGSSRILDGMLVEWSAELSCRELTDASGAVAGLLVGHVYDPEERAFRTGDIAMPGVSDAESLEAFLDTLSGAFFVLTSEHYGRRLYMDPGATLPLFWRTDRPVAGSSPEEIATPAELEQAFDKGLYDTCIGEEGMGSWIGGDLTAYANIRKLLNNHRLDLGTRSAHRYWPREETWLELPSAVEQASSSLLDFMAAAAERLDLKVALTAGYDTRLVLASSRKVSERVEYFTLAARGSELDQWAASAMAKRFGLKHRILPMVRSTPEDIAMWDRRVGYSVRESNREQFRSVAALGPTAVIATGMYGEVGRCRLYRQNVETINTMAITPEFVASRLTIPAPEPVRASLQGWLDGLSGFSPSVIMDLAFLELKFGAWAMGQKPATSQAAFTVSPMAQRPVLEAFVFTRPEDKRTTTLFETLIRACWPEVMAQPVNKYGDYRDMLVPLKKAMNPMRVRRYLRDRLAKSRAE